METDNETIRRGGIEVTEPLSNQGISFTSNKTKISGSCACGSVKWSSSATPTRGSFCYCGICRKLSGGAFIAFMDLPSSSVFFSASPFTSGTGSTTSSPSTLTLMALSKNAERGFCSACGSTLTMRYMATPETIYLTIASVDEDEGVDGKGLVEGLKKKHLYVRDKVEWYSLPDDGLPRFETMPNEAKYLVLED